jgi:hypothetical protein
MGDIDRDTQEHRSMDLFAYRELASDPGSPTHPALAVLVECASGPPTRTSFSRGSSGGPFPIILPSRARLAAGPAPLGTTGANLVMSTRAISWD